MKSNKAKIIVGIILVLFITVFGGAYFYAKSQVSPEKVREHTLTALKSTFPRSDIKLGKVDLSFGLSIMVNFASLEISEKKSKLLSLDNLDIRIPIFSILTGGGDLSVSLKSPTMHYVETRKSNNWEKALKKAKTTSSKKKLAKSNNKLSKSPSKNKNEDPSSLALPAFLLNSTVSLDISKLNVIYKLKDKSSGNVEIEKILFKKLGLKNSSAFEVQTAIKYKTKKKEQVSLDALLIGQFNLSQFISKGELESLCELKIKNAKLPGLANSLPEIKSKIKINVNKSGDINLGLDMSFLQSNNVKVDMAMKKGTINISNLKTNLLLADLMNISGIKLEAVRPGKSAISLNGKIYINKKGRINPNLRFAVSPDVTYVDKNFTTKAILKGALKNKDFTSSAEARVLDGLVVLQNSMKLDLNNPPSIEKLPKIFTLVNVSNLTISEGLIQEMVYTKKEAVEPAAETKEGSNGSSGAEKAKEEDMVVPLIPPGEVTIKMTNVKIDKKSLNFNSKISLQKNKVAIHKTNFTYSKGKGSVESVVNLSQKETKGVFKFNLKEFDLNGLKPFLPKDILKAITGDFSGAVSGNFKVRPKSTRYDVIAKVSAKNGELQDVNIGEYVRPLLLKVPKVGKKYADKVKGITGKFETLSLDGRFKENKYNFKSFRFIGLGKNIDLKGKGYVSPIPTSKSELYLTYRDPSGKITKVLNKELGTDHIPMRLVGKGYSLKPDVDYTVNKVSKTAVKAQGKKQLDKFLQKDSNKKKINKLLKGLFK